MVLKPVRSASRCLEASLLPSIARCAPNLVGLCKTLHNYSTRHNALTIGRYAANSLIDSIWNRCGSVMTDISWMTLSMALHPRFADFSFIQRACNIAESHKLHSKRDDNYKKSFLKQLRHQVAR